MAAANTKKHSPQQPALPFSKVFERWAPIEDLWVDVIERTVRNKPLIGAAMRVMNLGLMGREQSDVWMQKMAGRFGLPTGGQMKEALSLLQRLEDRVLSLEDEILALRKEAP